MKDKVIGERSAEETLRSCSGFAYDKWKRDHPNTFKWVIDAMERHASQFKEGVGQKEAGWVSVKDAEQFAMEFADYIENERWRYDHREQKTHTYAEHLAHFKQVYGGIEETPDHS